MNANFVGDGLGQGLISPCLGGSSRSCSSCCSSISWQGRARDRTIRFRNRRFATREDAIRRVVQYSRARGLAKVLSHRSHTPRLRDAVNTLGGVPVEEVMGIIDRNDCFQLFPTKMASWSGPFIFANDLTARTLAQTTARCEQHCCQHTAAANCAICASVRLTYATPSRFRRRVA